MTESKATLYKRVKSGFMLLLGVQSLWYI